MSALQNQVVQSLDGLSDDSLEFIPDMIQRFVKPAEGQFTETVTQGMDMIWMSVMMRLQKCSE